MVWGTGYSEKSAEKDTGILAILFIGLCRRYLHFETYSFVLNYRVLLRIWRKMFPKNEVFEGTVTEMKLNIQKKNCV